MTILEADDVVLILARSVIDAVGVSPVERKATYVFRRSLDGTWLWAIDNSYGHELLSSSEA